MLSNFVLERPYESGPRVQKDPEQHASHPKRYPANGVCMRYDSRKWNDEMYRKHATPYTGLAGFVERLRVQCVRSFANIKSTDTVLEIGCEGGNLMARLPESKRIVGAD